MTSQGERIAALEAHVQTLEAKVGDLEADRKRAFKTGIVLLGTAVIALTGWVIELLHK